LLSRTTAFGDSVAFEGGSSDGQYIDKRAGTGFGQPRST
jgi:hypothetical protein